MPQLGFLGFMELLGCMIILCNPSCPLCLCGSKSFYKAKRILLRVTLLVSLFVSQLTVCGQSMTFTIDTKKTAQTIATRNPNTGERYLALFNLSNSKDSTEIPIKFEDLQTTRNVK